MCTVTYIPHGSGFYMSSNRDENPGRAATVSPQIERLGSYDVLMPLDAGAGGTWMGLRNDGAVVILLNGAFFSHERKMPYRKSRGVIVKELLAQKELAETFMHTDLRGIEPFTLIIWQSGLLHRLVWDGGRHFRYPLSTTEPHIWSSATLYDEAVCALRHGLFYKAIEQQSEPNLQWLENFLNTAMPNDKTNRFVMQRSAALATLSISLINRTGATLQLKHIDLLQQPPQFSQHQLPVKGISDFTQTHDAKPMAALAH